MENIFCDSILVACDCVQTDVNTDVLIGYWLLAVEYKLHLFLMTSAN